MSLRKRKITVGPSSSVEDVWIVQHDQSPFNTVLGVFANETEAAGFAEEITGGFPGGSIYSRFTIGYRYDRGPGHVTYGAAD